MTEPSADQKLPSLKTVDETLEQARLRFERQKFALEMRAKRCEQAEQRDRSVWKALLTNPLLVPIVGGILALATAILPLFLTARANLENAQQALEADLIKKFVDAPQRDTIRANLQFLADSGFIPDYKTGIQEYLKTYPDAAPQIGDQSTVLSGTHALAADWPWLVSVHKSGVFICNGTLIASRVVLSAANCADYGEPTEVATVADYRTYVRDQRRIPIVKMFIHPSYSRSTWENDIAVLELGQDLPPPFATISTQGAADPGLGTLALVMTLNFQLDPGSLLQSVTMVADNQECAAQLYEGRSVPNGIICAGLENGRGGACPGSGSAGAPLVVYSRASRKYYQIGIVSVAQDCRTSGTVFGGYTRTSSYADWIKHLVPNVLSVTEANPQNRLPDSAPGR